MNKLMLATLALVPLTVSTAAMARDATIHSVEAAAKIAPRDGGAAIELANAYWRNNRTADAYDAYRRALVLDNVMLETRLGDPIWSHEVARRALSRPVTLAAR